jgi:hypothetical protein
MNRNFLLAAAAAAAFAASAASAQDYRGRPGPEYGQTHTVRCQSVQGRRNFCAVRDLARARISRQLSQRACIEGRNWSYSRRGISVSGGCRAEFRVTTQRDRRYGENEHGGYGDHRDDDYNRRDDRDGRDNDDRDRNRNCVDGVEYFYDDRGNRVTRSCDDRNEPNDRY